MKQIGCPVCSAPLSVRAAEGRKSHKPFVMLICDVNPRHFRGFITDQEYIRGVLDMGVSRKTNGNAARGGGRGMGQIVKTSRSVND